MHKAINGWTKATMKAQVSALAADQGAYTVRGKDMEGMDIRACLYRDDKNKACLAGVFIPDAHPALQERRSIIAVMMDFRDLEVQLPLTPTGMVELQQLHDKVVLNNKPVPSEGFIAYANAWIDANVIDPD